MNLECVTICVNFSDVLAHTLPLNKHHFNKMVVVRDEQDDATWNLCAHHHIECVTTNYFYHNDHAFNKGNGIIEGLRRLKLDDWVLHLDADIVLPPRFRSLLQNVVQPQADTIYGIDRMMCPSFEAWMQFVGEPLRQHTDQIFVEARPWPLGARVAKLDGDGYIPIGFFQLWNAAATGIKDYPNQHGTAGRTDMLHAMRWPRPKRLLIPEIVGIHLEGPQEKGKRNWRGRTMKPFGLTPAASSADVYS